MDSNGPLASAIAAFERGDLGDAREIAEKGVAADGSAQWQHLLGLIHCRAGDAQAGLPYLRVAARLEPTNLDFVIILIRALIDSGRPDEVLAMPKPVGTSRAALALWHGRAEAAAASGDANAAVDAWNNIVSATPADARAWINLGRSLLGLNEFGQAQAAYERALALAPDNIDAIEELGLVYERTNRLEALRLLLDNARERGIGKDRLNFLWAVRRYREGQIGEAGALLMQSNPARDPIRWHRLRANIADREGHASAAFAASLEVNRLTKDLERWRARASEFRRALRALARSIACPDIPRPTLVRSSGDASPAFIVGFPRSGTTLLDTFLMGHTSIVVLEEKEMLRRAARELGAVWSSPARLERARSECLRLMAEEAGSGPGRCIIDKDPLNMLAPHLIWAMFPQSPVIFVQRHPCDVVLSCFMQSFTPNLGMASFFDLSDAADFYDASMSLWTSATAKFPLNVRTVIYEDLVNDPERHLRLVIEFLGLAWEEGVLDHRATAAARGALMNTSYDQVTESLSARAVGRWRRYEAQLKPVLPKLLPWAERLGY